MGYVEAKRKKLVVYDKSYPFKLKENNLLPIDLILYNKITREVEFILRRKYESLEIKIDKGLKPNLYFKNDDLKDYRIIVKNPGQMQINKVYETKILSVENFVIKLEITNLIGSSSDYDIHFKRLISKAGVPIKFSDKVLNEANDLLFKAKKIKRTNLTFLDTITLDNPGAKDFDDAISCFKDDLGNYNLYIHIADVSHYVKEGSHIDNEARIRSFSIYPINGVIPMLPEEISNDLCSLKKDTVKDTISVIFKLSPTLEVLDFQIRESEIKVIENLYYDQIKENTKHINPKVQTILDNLKEIYNKFDKHYLYKETLDFYDSDPRFYFENENLCLDLDTKESYASKLIERLMIFTNYSVAKFFEKEKVSVPFRTHIEPNITDMSELKERLHYLDFPFKEGKSIKATLNNALKDLEGYMTLEKYLISDSLLKTQSKAIYEKTPGDHFALGIKPYLHFTAPIRRYADLLVHRQLKKVLNKGKLLSDDLLQGVINHINETEVKHMKLERNMFKLATILYFRKNGKKPMEAIITEMNKQGFYVKFKNGLEGFVPVRYLDDYYYYDELMDKFYSDLGIEFTIGDIINVRYLKSDLERMFCDFTVILWK